LSPLQRGAKTAIVIRMTRDDPHAETLAQWQAQAAAVRARTGAEPGVARPEQVAGASGMELLTAMLEGRIPPAHIAHTLDFALVHVAFGEAIFQGRPGRAHYNPLGSVHGGWFATLLDSALGCAVHTTLPAGKGYTTLELKVNLVRALSDRVPLVRAEGRVVHGGKQVATADARLVGHDGKLYAHATTTCLIFDMRA
jgi:uncharacterized protein (TIGR00369 family)